jgi:pimeloyl-ACP methyl ester carboxylesterase
MLGGYDQGLAIAGLIGLTDFRFIAVSRPGYLRTPLRTGPAFDQQADAFAALLDSLGISRAAIIGISAGGPPALAFARRHRDRCIGLVLMSAVTRRLVRNEVKIPRAMRLSTSALADFGYWLLRPVAVWNPRLAAAGMHLQAEAQVLQDLSIKSPFLKVTESFVPLSIRRVGMLNDEIQIRSLPESVTPVDGPKALIIHGTMDRLVPYDSAVAAARAMPSAELMPIEGCGHLTAIFNAPRIRSAIAPFLSS